MAYVMGVTVEVVVEGDRARRRAVQRSVIAVTVETGPQGLPSILALGGHWP